MFTLESDHLRSGQIKQPIIVLMRVTVPFWFLKEIIISNLMFFPYFERIIVNNKENIIWPASRGGLALISRSCSSGAVYGLRVRRRFEGMGKDYCTE